MVWARCGKDWLWGNEGLFYLQLEAIYESATFNWSKCWVSEHMMKIAKYERKSGNE